MHRAKFCANRAGPTTADIWFFDIQDGGRPPSWIFKADWIGNWK